MSYVYWNDFVKKWQSLPTAEYINPAPAEPFHPFCGWENPNLQPLLNSDTPGDYSLKYLPEPWWGNDSSHPLNSVVINYNPGGGGGIQDYLHACLLFGNHDYSSFADSEACKRTNHFAGTNRWHQGQRATRIFNTLSRIGFFVHPNNKLCNHLSIELIPWHTANTTTISTYISNNLHQIYQNCLLFAGDQSRRIDNEKLKNKVIMRLSGDKALNLLNSMVANGFGFYTIITPIGYTYIGTPPPVPHGKGGYMKFKFNVIPDIEFICIWGTGRTGNAFPPNDDMDWIFTHIV